MIAGEGEAGGGGRRTGAEEEEDGGGREASPDQGAQARRGTLRRRYGLHRRRLERQPLRRGARGRSFSTRPLVTVYANNGIHKNENKKQQK